MYQKVWCRCKVIVLLAKSTFFSFFFMFSLNLKLPYQSVLLGGGGGDGGGVVLFNHFAEPPQLFYPCYGPAKKRPFLAGKL